MRQSALALFVVLVSSFAGVGIADVYNWGSEHSFYKGNRVVSGEGKQLRKDGGSFTKVKATDRRRDGNVVHGFTDWYKLEEECKSVGVSAEVVESGSTTCSVKTERIARWDVKVARDGKGQWNRGKKLQSWCNDDGQKCADYGLKQVSGACAQMGWPVPDSCTRASVVYHRP